MLDYWIGFPDRIPYCPWHLADMVALMRERGYSNFAFVKHHDEFKTVELNDAQVKVGDWGNLIFLHDSAFEQLVPALYKASIIAQAELITKAKFFRTEAQKRLSVIEQLDTECHKRLEVIQELNAECQKRLEVIQRLDTQLNSHRGR